MRYGKKGVAAQADFMLYFVWSDPLPLYSGRGGSESFTIGHAHELLGMGVPVEIITVGLGKNDGRKHYPDIVFNDIKSLDELKKFKGTIVYVSRPHSAVTAQQSYAMLHVPPLYEFSKKYYAKAAKANILITNSRFMQKEWADYLGVSRNTIEVLNPFADPHFASVKRGRATKKKRVLFAGRLSTEKGIYTFLESLHHDILRTGFEFTITTAGRQTKDGRMLEKFLRHHPWLKVIDAQHSRQDMAELLAKQDIVVMPSNHYFWHEPFGMLSIEAQHAGCRVIASNDGGLPETNCGSLLLFKPGSSLALAETIVRAAKMGPVPDKVREQASQKFTRRKSVNRLLAIIRKHSKE